MGGSVINPLRRESKPDLSVRPRRGAVVRSRRESWLPGTSIFWVGLAISTFALAIGLAFGLNSNSDSASEASNSIQSPSSAVTHLEDSSGLDLQSLDGETPVVDGDQSEIVVSEVSLTESATQQLTTQEPSIVAAETALTGFIVPIPGACLSEFDGHLPGSLREYRNGIHEGIDFYGFASCVSLGLGSVVIASKGGIVIRADTDYSELTQAELAAAEASGFQGEEALDLFRGRQIWIDHGGDIVTRYAHLSDIASGIVVGDSVSAGSIIGFVGESGSPTSLDPVETDFHLHFEIRVGDSYLGEGLLPADARQLYFEAFGVEA